MKIHAKGSEFDMEYPHLGMVGAPDAFRPPEKISDHSPHLNGAPLFTISGQFAYYKEIEHWFAQRSGTASLVRSFVDLESDLSQ
ncbi:unnamed protein product [Plutella xylostella]|uniref:(diamondback moth) hypothetical protein n=1 Tax=Plutella xylostella TaxID=51655 RepID=A0A8S4E3K4_PLUXY|nr:unnamed protein product [Plutella xylostella]